MRIFLYLILAAAAYALYSSYPAINQFRTWPDDKPLGQDVINRILLCLVGGVVWAIYLASTVVPLIGQWVIDVLFSVKGLRQTGLWEENKPAAPLKPSEDSDEETPPTA